MSNYQRVCFLIWILVLEDAYFFLSCTNGGLLKCGYSTPKSSILIGFSTINQPFHGFPIYRNPKARFFFGGFKGYMPFGSPQAPCVRHGTGQSWTKPMDSIHIVFHHMAYASCYVQISSFSINTYFPNVLNTFLYDVCIITWDLAGQVRCLSKLPGSTSLCGPGRWEPQESTSHGTAAMGPPLTFCLWVSKPQ